MVDDLQFLMNAGLAFGAARECETEMAWCVIAEFACFTAGAPHKDRWYWRDLLKRFHKAHAGEMPAVVLREREKLG